MGPLDTWALGHGDVAPLPPLSGLGDNVKRYGGMRLFMR